MLSFMPECALVLYIEVKRLPEMKMQNEILRRKRTSKVSEPAILWSVAVLFLSTRL